MSSCTCELIFGKASMNDSGITFNHRLTLYEGFKAVLVFEQKPSVTDGGALIDRWIPHPDLLLKDSMVMLAAYGAEDEKVLRLIDEVKEKYLEQDMLDLNKVDDVLMEKLYTAAKQAFRLEVRYIKNGRSSDRWKVTACIFGSSSMFREVKYLKDYDIDIEVCQPIYQSEYSPWNEEINVWGELA